MLESSQKTTRWKSVRTITVCNKKEVSECNIKEILYKTKQQKLETKIYKLSLI